jgi:hypothetical protein
MKTLKMKIHGGGGGPQKMMNQNQKIVDFIYPLETKDDEYPKFQMKIALSAENP